MLNWSELQSADQLEQIKLESLITPVVIFKHSTRCNISSMVKDRLERKWNMINVPAKAYYLDLLNYREISNQIASDFEIEHQSPQMLIISSGDCRFHSSHNEIDVNQILDQLTILQN